MGLFQITIWTTHLNNRISVSANEIVCNWILKRSIIPTGILIGSYQEFLIAEIYFFQLENVILHRGCLFYESMSLSQGLSQIHFTL